MGETKVEIEILYVMMCVFFLFLLFFEPLCERRVSFFKCYALYNCMFNKKDVLD